MDPLHAWLLVAMLAAISFTTRASFIVLLANAKLPPGLQRSLRFVPAAVFPALVLPDMAWIDGVLELGPSNPKLVAGIIAGVFAWRTRNTLGTIAVGLSVLHLWPLLAGTLAGLARG